MLVCAICAFLARETAGAAPTRHSLRPLFEEGQTNLQSSGETRRKNNFVVPGEGREDTSPVPSRRTVPVLQRRPDAAREPEAIDRGR
jgi:hypothetical protein